MKRPKESWFTIRRDLTAGRSAFLTTCSFLLPLLIWSVFSYVPFIWHPDIKLNVGSAGDTVYTAGDHVGKDFFPTLLAGVQNDNKEILAASASAEPPKVSSRANVKQLRQLHPIAVSNGLLTTEDGTNDKAIFNVWKGIATGKLELKKPKLSEENFGIVKTNYQILSNVSEDYDKSALSSEALLSLLPQGKAANPVYLPAPHEVVREGIRAWREEPAEGRSSMGDRLRSSIYVVFGGFLLAAFVAVPLGIISGSYDFFSKLTEPFFDFFRYMPAPSFATLLVAVLGAHQSPKLALVFIGTLPHLLLMISKTTRNDAFNNPERTRR
jgi:NitT/TauT family transport system permease protein